MYFHRPIQNTSVFFKAHECLLLSHFSKSKSVNYLKKIFAILLYIRVVASDQALLNCQKLGSVNMTRKGTFRSCLSKFLLHMDVGTGGVC